ncbi:MAG: sterol carrier protein [Candidatus Lokiarchaeota archaeon]|nr:sterol carrier protein [Candidatus Lokiarchaeota archaeon]MBD3199591.1 sterol carrier protein [Candidatus Lokiarchaeota archaeon]
MTVKILSEEWVKEFGKAINNNPSYKEAAAWWTGDMLVHVEPSGPLDHDVKFFLGLHKGECTGTHIIKEGDNPDCEFILAGPYDNFVKVAKGELDTIQGVMSGKLKLTGNMAKLMRATRAAQEIVNSLQNIDTEFL